MCGIFAYIASNAHVFKKEHLEESFKRLKQRGPDNSTLIELNENITFGFHRLSINDLSDLGNQPFQMNDVSLICNGEIFNYNELKTQFGFETVSNSDCEIIIHLYKHFKGNVGSFIDLLDAEFSFILYDNITNEVIIARDSFGVRPLFYGLDRIGEHFFASELKGINELCNGTIIQFPAGTFMKLVYKNSKYVPSEIIKWFDTDFKINEQIIDSEDIYSNIRDLFYTAVKKRLMSERPICCLLSGGLDSSLVASIVAKNIPPGTLNTFSIGMEGSPDLYYAQKVADFIGSKHHSVVLSENDFLSAIPETIGVIESFDTTSVRASVANYLIGKYISENTDFKVVLNGDGSDEFGSYLYFSKAPDEESFHNEANRLLSEIHFFDVLRSDRSISSNGLEARVPFLDKDFARYYASIPPKFKMHNSNMEKYILRKAFEPENLLPTDVLWRSKMAFSDGVSIKNKSWHTIISEYVDTLIPDEEFENNKKLFTHCPPMLKESYFYRLIFDQLYGSHNCNVIPHFWLPKWCGNLVDPSARELSFNKEII